MKNVTTRLSFFLALILSFTLTTAFAQSTNTENLVIQKKVADQIVNNLNSNKYEEVRKDLGLLYKNTVSREVIAQNWESVLALLGNFKKIISYTSIKDFVGNDLLKVRCEHERENMTIEVTFNSDNKVIMLYFRS